MLDPDIRRIWIIGNVCFRNKFDPFSAYCSRIDDGIFQERSRSIFAPCSCKGLLQA